MKRNFSFKKALGLFGFLGLMTFASGCLKDQCTETRTFVRVDPVYVQLEDFRKPIEISGPRELKEPGIIYSYGQYLLINERREGIHVIDNSDPASPQAISFITIPGNVDLAVREGYLYADSYLDLLTIDISNPASPSLVKRSENVFKPLWQDQNLGYCMFYRETEETTQLDCSDPNFNEQIFWNGGAVFMSDASAASGSSGGGNGIGGSFARFTLNGSRLYMVDQYSLSTYNVETPSAPVFVNNLQLGWGIETIFPQGQNLFVGASNGMHILSVANPDAPKYLSRFDHANACDPVFVEGNTAYVTLRNGNRCQGFTNQLDILDISDLRNPKQIKSYSMDHPHGLSVVNDKLFLCEGIHGLKVFDVRDKQKIQLMEREKSHHAYDVISLGSKHLLMIGDDGLYQYNTADPANIREISRIPVSSN